MCARNSSLKIVIFLALLLMPFILSGISYANPVSINKTGYNKYLASSTNSFIVAGDFQYFKVKLNSEAEKISIIAFYGDSIPEIKDRSYSNYYIWEYENGIWKDASGYDKEYIKTSECKIDNNIYYFCIGIDSKAKPGNWNYKIIVDNQEKETFNCSILVIAQFNFFLSTLVVLNQPNTVNKKFLSDIDYLCSERKKIEMEYKDDIENKVDEAIRKKSNPENKENKDELQNSFYLEITPYTNDETNRVITSNYQRSKLKNKLTDSKVVLFKEKNLGGAGFWFNKFNVYSKFLVLLFTILLLFTAFAPVISPNEAEAIENISSVINIDNNTINNPTATTLTGDEIKVDLTKKSSNISPFDVFELPPYSLGPKVTKIVNTSYFWNYFDNYNKWYLEAWDSKQNKWVDISNHLIVIQNRSKDDQYEKISLEFEAPITTDYKVGFIINTPLKRYINNSDQFEYTLIYQVDKDEEYVTYYNFSDMAGIPGVFLDYGVKKQNGNDIFWFSAQKNNILAGTYVVLDPTFGNTGTSTSTTTIKDYIGGGYFQMEDYTGYGESITAYLLLGGKAKTAKCAIYDSSKNLVANSMTEELSYTTGWNTFYFGTNKPVLTANAWYYIVIWGSSTDKKEGDLYYATSGGSGVFTQSVTYVSGSYNGFPNTFTTSTVDADGLGSIYCTFNEANPPTPNPMTWATEPYDTSSSSISMIATTASDSTPPIYYYFNETTDNPGGTDSGWQESTSYTDSGLSENTQYGYEVKARDSNSTPNEGSYSTPISYEYTDVNPPIDDELTFLIGETWINATVSEPPNPTAGSTGSYFNWLTGGSINSGWQTGVYYHNRTGLTENTQYGTQVRYCNGDADPSNYNPTEKKNYTYCDPPENEEFTIDGYGDSWINMSVAHPTNPSVGSTAAYFECVTGGASDSGWVTNSSGGRYYYNATGLTNGVLYGFRVKYRNAESVETEYTSEKKQTTIFGDLPTVTTTTATGIKETNATLKGYLNDNVGLPTITGFHLGTTLDNMTTNLTVGITENQNEFSYNAQSLKPGQLYYYRAWANNSAGFVNASNNLTMLTKPYPVLEGSLTLKVNNTNTIYLNWTKGLGANNTYIERNTSSNWALGQGIAIYNNTGDNYEDTGLIPGTTYYYQAWSYATWTYNPTVYKYSDEYESESGKTKSIPYQTQESPTNQSVGICPIPILSVKCIDNDSTDTMNATWWSNSSGEWVQFDYNNNIANNTIIQKTNSNFSSTETTYYWSVNLTDGTNWKNNTYKFRTNYAPTQSGESPTNGAVNVQTTPSLFVICTDLDTGQSMTASWRSNSTGLWQTFATNYSIATGTNITQINSNFNNPSTTYYWSINLTDGCYWTNHTYSFSTTSINTNVEKITPYNITISPLQINTIGTSTLDSITLWYRWSTDNRSWDGNNWSWKNDTVDSNTCDVDSSPDKGTESNFTNAQDIVPDSNVMTLLESDYGIIGVDESLYVDGYTATSNAWTLTGTSPYLDAVGDGSYISESKNGDDTYWYTFSDTTATGDGFTVTLYVYATEGDGDDDVNIYIDTNGDNTPEFTTIINDPTSGWFNTGPITGLTSATQINAVRVWFEYSTGTPPGNTITLDAAYLHVQRTSAPNYNIDFEYQWTSAKFSEQVEKVCIYVSSHSGNENLNVNYWNDDSWANLGTITTTGWNNFTATGLTSSTYTIQLIGTTESSDTTQDTWNIDSMFLQTYSPNEEKGSNWQIWNDDSNPDTTHPWSWNFDFPNRTGYYEFYSIGKKAGIADEIAPSIADAICYFEPPFPIINSYDLRNITGSKLNNITGLLDVNKEYYFTINITASGGWEFINYINITSWYDNGDDNTVYNQTLGGNLNMFLQYENISGIANFRMLWPKNEAEIILENCSEQIINSTTRIINISFMPLSQVRWGSSNETWNTTQNAYNNSYSWNFNITVLDENYKSDWKIDEYGIYRYTSIYLSKDRVDFYGPPGFSDTSDVVTITYSSNYDFNITIYFEDNLRNETRGVTIPIANNIKILAGADLNDDITTDMTFLGIGQEYAIDIINISGIFQTENVSQTIKIQFEIYIPLGTLGLKYTARIATKIIQK